MIILLNSYILIPGGAYERVHSLKCFTVVNESLFKLSTCYLVTWASSRSYIIHSWLSCLCIHIPTSYQCQVELLIPW